MAGIPYQPHEDAVLLPYVDQLCNWRNVLPSLPARNERSARRRLTLLRHKAGTAWKVDTRAQRRVRGRFA